MMATPTTYSLTYDAPCDVEAGCGDAPCGGKPEFIPRPQIFCKDVRVQGSETVQGDMFVVPEQIFVGGARYSPQEVVAANGTFICLARA
jgi:hypothetical protein